MIKHIWSVLCQKSIVDQQTNNVSLLDVFEALELEITPAQNTMTSSNPEFNVPVQYEIISLLSKEKADPKDTQYSIRITLINPGGEKKILVDRELPFLANKRRMRSINQIRGLPINKSGDYHFVVAIKQDERFQEVADLPLEVKLNLNNPPKEA